MSAGSARLHHTLKTLRERWEIVKEQWNDRVSQEFEKNHLVPLEQQSTTAIHGMEKMGEVITKLRSEFRHSD